MIVANNKRLRNFIENASSTLILIAGFILAIMMAITTLDVSGRYLLGFSLPGSTELIRASLAVSVSLALPAVTWRSGNIALGLFKGHPNRPVERLRNFFVSAISAVVFGVLSVLLFHQAFDSLKNEDVIGYLELPIAPVVFILSIISAFTAMIFAVQSIGTDRLIRSVRSDHELG
jgi:TRAP-type C4-dicarboxylate transport system permease small subunit